MNYSVGPGPVVDTIAVLLSQSRERKRLSGVLHTVGRRVIARSPARVDLAGWDGVALVLADEAAARLHLETLLALKQRARPAFLPLLIVLRDGGSGAPWLRAGFDKVLRAPLAGAELLAQVEALLRVRAEWHEAVRGAEARFRAVFKTSRRNQAEERFRATFDYAPVGIMHHDPDGNILHVNAKLCEILGYPRDELLRLTIKDLPHPDHVGKDQPKYLPQMLAGKLASFTSERRYLRKDGTSVWVDRTVSLVRDASGKPLYFIRIIEDVTERRRAEAALRESERFARATIDALGHHICVIDADGRIIAVNEAWRAFACADGLSPEPRWEGTNYFEVCDRAAGMGARDSRAVAAGIRSVLAGIRERFTLEYSCRCATELRWFAVKAFRFPGEGPLRAVISREDITERTVSARRRAMEHAVARVLAESESVAEAMPQLIRTLCEAMDWVYGAHWVWNSEEDNLLRAEFWCEFEPEFGPADRESWFKLTSRNAGGLLRRALHAKEASWIVDVLADRSFKRAPSSRKLGLRSAYAFPILAGSTVIGVMEFFGREVRQPDEMLLQITRAIGSQIGQFIRRKQAEETLRLSEERFRAAFNQASIGITITDLDLRYLQANDKYCEMVGYSREELLRLAVKDVNRPEDREEATHYRRRLVADEISTYNREKPLLRKDGSLVWVNLATSLVRGTRGEPRRFVSVIQDISERKRAEAALHDSEARFRNAFDFAPIGMALVTPEGRFLQVNRALCEITGYSGEELLRLTFQQITHPEDLPVNLDNLRRVLSGESYAFQMEKRYLHKDGGIVWIKIAVTTVRGDDGRPLCIIAQIENINDRKRAEAALRQSEEQFRQLATNIPQVFWICDAAQREAIYVSPAYENITGRTRRAVTVKPRAWLYAVHADDRRRVLAARKGALNGDYDEEYRIVQPDGSIRWVHDRAFPVHDADGRAYRIAGIAEDITERKQAEERLMYLAHYDGLTSLPNRILFYDRLKQALAQAKRNQWTLAVMFIDLDRFKNVNDTLGHGMGDRLLQQVSERVAQCVRAGDTVGRLGGDEFAVVLSNLASAQDASLVAQKVMASCAAPLQLDGTEVYVTASIGITLFPNDSTDQDTLIRNADTAMYRAKEVGRNSYQFYMPEMNARALEKLSLESRLRRALERREFLLYYQPRIGLATGKVIGVEALLRWQHPEMGLVPPADFMPMLEETGLIIPAGEWVIRAACAQIRAWQADRIGPVAVAVNLSARQFQAKDLGETVRRIVDESGIGEGLLEFEITESSLMHNTEEAAATLGRLKALGIRVAIDDFGTGYSSLGYLKRFPLDALKVDRSFVRDVNIDADDAAITRAVIMMAHSLGLKVVAEGVETEAQLRFLVANGCDEVQGYYFARPLPPGECAGFLRRKHRLA